MHRTWRAASRRASSRACPSCSMPVADSQPAYGSQCFRKGCWRAAWRLPASSCTTPSSTAGQRAPRSNTSSSGADCGLRLLRWNACICHARVGLMEVCTASATEGITEPQAACLVAICGADDRGRYNSPCWHAGAAALRRMRAMIRRPPYARVRCVNRTEPIFAVPGEHVVA